MDIQKSFFTAALVAATLTLNSLAATNGFYAPYFRGVAGTEVAGWERFSSGYNVANQPDMSGSNMGSRATLTQAGVLYVQLIIVIGSRLAPHLPLNAAR
jgi:hypothetical protein